MDTAAVDKPGPRFADDARADCKACNNMAAAVNVQLGQPEAGKAAALERSASLRHIWEDDVADYLLHEVTSGCRECCQYAGMPLARKGHKPLLLALVQGMDEAGQPFVWVARRCRKRVRQPYECPDPPPQVRWLDGLSFKHHYDKPGWWVAALFAVGSVVWLITGIARLTTPVSMPDTWPPGLDSLSAGLSVWPEVAALYLTYLPACLLQVYEASNMDWGARLRAWKRRADQQGEGPGAGPNNRAPRPRLLPSAADLATVSWWLAMMQLLGILVFMAAVTTELVGTGRLLSDYTYKWGVSFLFFIGGLLFSGASWMACLEETGSYWRGVVPSRMADVRSISWLAVFFALQGSLGFMLFGVVFFSYPDISWGSTQAIMAYGQVWASICFIVSSGAGLLEQANPSHL